MSELFSDGYVNYSVLVFSRGLLVTETAARGDTALRRVRNLGGHVLATEEKRVRLASKVKLSERESFPFFPRMRRPTSCQGILGVSTFLKFIIYFI